MTNILDCLGIAICESDTLISQGSNYLCVTFRSSAVRTVVGSTMRHNSSLNGKQSCSPHLD